MDRTIPINEAGAEAILKGVEDTAVQTLLRAVVATARMEFIRRTDQSEKEWQAQLPAAPFDMEFFARVLAKALAQPETVRRILDGASIAEVSGWDV
jgi:hypothetical protein